MNGQSWLLISDFPGSSRDDATGFFLNGVGYFGLGIDYNYLLRNDFFSYSPTTNEWHSGNPLPGEARQYVSAFAVGKCAYLIGGGVLHGNTNEVWRICTDGQWFQLADAPFVARAAATGFVIGEYIYYGTGRDTIQKLNDFWRFDTSIMEWVQLSNVPFKARDEAVGFSTFSNGYLVMGNGDKCFSDVWKYSPKTDSWSRLADFPGKACKYACGIDIGEKLVIAGGQSHDDNWLNEAWMFDGISEEWHAWPSYPASRRGMEGFGWRGSAVFCTGLESSLARSNECWKISVGTDNDLLPYPNPAVKVVNIAIRFSESGMEFQTEIYDLFGRLVMSNTYQPVYDVVQVNLPATPGLYFIKYSDGGELHYYPVLVHRGED